MRKAIGSIAVLALLATFIYGHAAGPDARHTGGPGDDALACATSGCHTGPPINGGGGNVAVNFQNGLTYTPGVQQTFSLAVTDSKAKAYGFQMTARLESNLSNGQAGDFTAGPQQLVLCDNGSLKGSKGCAQNSPVQFIEHSAPFSSNTISITWTPPASNVGNVRIYVAANAANHDGTSLGDHIYTASYVFTPHSSGTRNRPTTSSLSNSTTFH